MIVVSAVLSVLGFVIWLYELIYKKIFINFLSKLYIHIFFVCLPEYFKYQITKFPLFLLKQQKIYLHSPHTIFFKLNFNTSILDLYRFLTFHHVQHLTGYFFFIKHIQSNFKHHPNFKLIHTFILLNIISKYVLIYHILHILNSRFK